MEPENVVAIQWDVEKDRCLLLTVDDYVSEFGKLYEQDWQIIALFGFKDPTLVDAVKARYEVLSTSMKIKTHADYIAYQRASDKQELIKGRNIGNISAPRHDDFEKDDFVESNANMVSSLKLDILMVKSVTAHDTLLERRVWEYLGGQRRIGFMRYLDLADKIIDRLPDREFINSRRCERDLTDDIWSMVEKFGDPFKKNCGGKMKPITLKPVTGLHLADERGCHSHQPYSRGTVLNARMVKEKMETKENDLFSPEEWEKIFSVQDDWSAVLTRARRGDKPGNWFSDECFLENEKLFKKKMKSVGIRTHKSREDVELEFCGFVLPNYWLFPGTLVVKESHFFERKCKRRLDEMDNSLCICIYHALTVVSLKHVRKTILYLFAAGIIGGHGFTPTYYYNGFVRFLAELPCGECWLAEPVEFKKIQNLIKTETQGLNIPEIPHLNDVKRWKECRKGDGCWWKQTGISSDKNE